MLMNDILYGNKPLDFNSQNVNSLFSASTAAKISMDDFSTFDKDEYIKKACKN